MIGGVEGRERRGVDDWLFGLSCYACAWGWRVVGHRGHWCVHDTELFEVGLELGGRRFGLVLDGCRDEVLVVDRVHVIV